jgi:FAD/FMN-containing dehydrogenase
MRLLRTRRRRYFLLLAILLVAPLLFLAKPALHLLSVSWNDIDDRRPLADGYIDDASRMNATRVDEIWPVPDDPKAAEEQLAELLNRATKENKRVSIAGARHTMGGHTIYPGGIVVNMLPFNGMSLDEKHNILAVGAGARWGEVLAYLDARTRSVAVMQSNNSFSVGGSLGCNCHGWQFGEPPISSTVDSFRLMKADGSIVRCSRDENEELFSLVVGGYGLFGIMLDVNLRVVPNQRYRLEQFIVPAAESLATFDERIADRDEIAMAYGRLCITPAHFLDEAIINVLYVDPAPDGVPPPLRAAESVKLRRSMFRGSVGSDYGKELRWSAEVKLQPQLVDTYFSRNQLLNEGVEIFQNRSADSADILHEYFLPRDGLARFIQQLQRIIPEHEVDLLNVTVRFVREDRDTLLRYADQDLFALVMLFNQPTSAVGEARMEAMTRDLIDAAFSVGGRYYLPYRLHATQQQFQRAYPQAQEFFMLKRKHDPEELFQNQFYIKYGRNSEWLGVAD